MTRGGLSERAASLATERFLRENTTPTAADFSSATEFLQTKAKGFDMTWYASRLERFLLTCGLLVSLVGSTWADDLSAGAVKNIGKDSVWGLSNAVLVDDLPLWHSAQIEPVEMSGGSYAEDVDRQTRSVLTTLTKTLERQNVPLANVVKLNVYLARPETFPAVRSVIHEFFRGQSAPAVSLVQTKLRASWALVAMDAVAVAEKRDSNTKVELVTEPKSSAALLAKLPRGPRVYVSGQAEKGASLAEATTKTMQSLSATLTHLGCEKRDVVQVKSFLTPMSDVAGAEKSIAEFFAPHPAPPCVFVEWQSTLPIEIELIAAARPQPESKTPLEFITPPGMTASPVFCRVVRINDPRTIFVGGLFAKDATDGTGQVMQVFEQLQDILKASGSDLRHLAKGTYYVSDNDVSTRFNDLRPKFYDPARPPAASKAQVLGVGQSNHSLTIDMIAVPTPRP